MFKKIIFLSAIFLLTSCQLPFQNQEEEISISPQSNFITPISQNSTGQNFIGNVHSAEQVKIQSPNSGQIIKSFVKDGDQVQKGDLLFEINGINNSNHPLITQFQIAQINFDNAKENLEMIKKANQNTNKSATLQVNSAQNQAKAFQNDLQTFDLNIAANLEAKNILQDNLVNNNYLNRANSQKSILTIQDIENNLNQLNSAFQNNINEINQMIDRTTEASEQENLLKKLNAANLEYNQKKDSINNQLKIAQINLNSLENSSNLSANQSKTLLLQNQLQTDLVQINQESSKLKMGYDNQSTDQIKNALNAQEGIEIKNQMSLAQAESQLNLAKINLENAKAQLNTLNIYAPISGVIYATTASEGELISQQNILTQIINPHNLELIVEIQNEDIQKVMSAKLPYANKFIDLPIKSISNIANPQSKLAQVIFYLPNLPFNPNQNLNVTINFNQDNQNTSKLLIPLEALQIDDSNQKFVYLKNNQDLIKNYIQVGELQNNFIEVISGLNPEDQILINL